MLRPPFLPVEDSAGWTRQPKLMLRSLLLPVGDSAGLMRQRRTMRQCHRQMQSLNQRLLLRHMHMLHQQAKLQSCHRQQSLRHLLRRPSRKRLVRAAVWLSWQTWNSGSDPDLEQLTTRGTPSTPGLPPPLASRASSRCSPKHSSSPSKQPQKCSKRDVAFPHRKSLRWRSAIR